MPLKPYDPPLWARLYPDLADKETLALLYETYRTIPKVAEFEGCGEKTVRKALKYHGFGKPFFKKKH